MTLKTGARILFFLTFFFYFSQPVLAQSSTSASNYTILLLAGVGLVLVIGILLSLAENLLQVEAKKQGVDTSDGSFSIFPSLTNLFQKSPADYIGNANSKVLKKGFDIKLDGAAADQIETVPVNRYAIKPTNFIGMSPIPKVTVEVGNEVQAGDVLFFDKKRPEIKYVSPVSGEVIEINRGEKRSIASVVVLADKDIRFKNFTAPSLEANREDLVQFLLDSGAWTLVNERPFDIVPNPDSVPRDIFISTFDTAPLAPNNNLIVKGQGGAFQKGLDVLAKLTPGKIYLGLDGNGTAPAKEFSNATGVEQTYFSGKHPAGNVGIQIHHTAPIGSNDKVWTFDAQSVISLGNLFLTGKMDMSRIVAVAGSKLHGNVHAKTYPGASVADLLKGNDLVNRRIISGDVLSGSQIDAEGYLDYKSDQLTVIDEGNYYEMFGWLLPIAPRPSTSGTFPNFLYRNHKFEADTNTHGEKRAFVMTGQYERFLPMDILPQHLMKAIMANDFERMEGLGIHELSEEDLALAEFGCTSKAPLQSILREGLDVMMEQG